MSRFDRIIKKFDSLISEREKLSYARSAIADYVIPAVAIVTGGVELNHVSNIKSNVVDNRVSNPAINWTTYFNETTGEQIKALPPEVTPVFYESPWTACLLQQGVNIACAINLGLTYAELKGAKSLGEKIKKGAWLGFHGAAALLSKYFTWGSNGVTSREVSVPETYANEPNLTTGSLTLDSYLNGVIASGIALGIEGACAYRNVSKLFNSNKRLVEIKEEINNFYHAGLDELDITDYDANASKQIVLGKMFVGKYPDLADSVYANGSIPNVKELLGDVSKRTSFKDYADSFGCYNTATIEDLYGLYLRIPFEGGLDIDESINIGGVTPQSIKDEIAIKGLTYEQVLKGIKAYLMP